MKLAPLASLVAGGSLLVDYTLTVAVSISSGVMAIGSAFGFNDKLSYQVISNLAMAQHRSQGSYQMLVGRWTSETFRRFALEAPDAVARTDGLFRRLAEPQWPKVEYDEDGELVEAR